MYRRGDYSVGAFGPAAPPATHSDTTDDGGNINSTGTSTSSSSNSRSDGREGGWQRWAAMRALTPADATWAAAYGYHVPPSPGRGRASGDPPEDLFFPPSLGARIHRGKQAFVFILL